MAPPNDRKKSKCLVILILRRFRGGPVEGLMGGQSGDIFRGGPVKKTHCNFNKISWLVDLKKAPLFTVAYEYIIGKI